MKKTSHLFVSPSCFIPSEEFSHGCLFSLFFNRAPWTRIVLSSHILTIDEGEACEIICSVPGLAGIQNFRLGHLIHLFDQTDTTVRFNYESDIQKGRMLEFLRLLHGQTDI